MKRVVNLRFFLFENERNELN